MPVFISYHRPDELRAMRIQLYLMIRNVDAYIDVLDPELEGSENVTRRILDALSKCTHLLALISTTTMNSWWVPFEIGVATDREQRISSYATSMVQLPQYLSIWPVLRSDADLAQFAKRYHEDRIVLQKGYKTYEAERTHIQRASDFHRVLKSDLKQI